MRVLLFLFGLIPLWGCSQQPVRLYQETDSIIKISAGENFMLRLPSNIGTGYTWELSEQPDSSLLTLISREYKSGGDEDNGPGYDELLFKAHRKGKLELKLQYVRPWKKDNAGNPDIRRKTYPVIIE